MASKQAKTGIKGTNNKNEKQKKVRCKDCKHRNVETYTFIWTCKLFPEKRQEHMTYCTKFEQIT
jgi:hypothetical protein